MGDLQHSLHRARIAREVGTVKKDWGGKISVALAYPNSYRTGMSNLGYQVLYHHLNEKNNVVAERIFLPETKEGSFRLESGKGLLSMESLSPLQRFDILAFSLPFENDFLNILKILELGKIPLLSEERKASHPMVMAGGVTTFLNPEPLASFIDLFLIGEAEPVLDGFFDVYIEARNASTSRGDVLRSLARHVPAAYVPSFYHLEYNREGTIQCMEPTEQGIPEVIKAACHQDPDAPVAVSKILTPETAFADKVRGAAGDVPVELFEVAWAHDGRQGECDNRFHGSIPPAGSRFWRRRRC